MKTLGFGNRRNKGTKPTDCSATAKVTATERLKEIGNRWWRASGLQKKKVPRTKGFKRSRIDP